MCISPCTVPNIGPVACRYCWQCRANRVNDWVGRCIAEMTHSSLTLATTFTYAGDVPNAATLVYADIQKLIKKLRSAGYKVRYLVTGEYGSKKGRAHWHCCLFFSGDKIPEIQNDPQKITEDQVCFDHRYNWPHWDHGFSFFQKPDWGAFAYAIKYILKDQEQTVARSHFAMSKKPPLGMAFFQELARDHVNNGLSPQTPHYSFRDVFDNKGKRRRFFLQGRTRELFSETFLGIWAEIKKTEYPFSEMLEQYEERVARQDEIWTDEQWRDHFDARFIPGLPPRDGKTEYYHDSNGDLQVRVHEELFTVVNPETETVVSGWSDRTFTIYAKDTQWHGATLKELEKALVAMGEAKTLQHINRLDAGDCDEKPQLSAYAKSKIPEERETKENANATPRWSQAVSQYREERIVTRQREQSQDDSKKSWTKVHSP